jgi:hypothetical protein
MIDGPDEQALGPLCASTAPHRVALSGRPARPFATARGPPLPTR